MKKPSISQIYLSRIIFNICLIPICSTWVIYLLIDCKDFFGDIGIFAYVLYPVVVVFSVAFIVSSLRTVITLLKDRKSVKNKKYIEITGKVIKFKKNINPDTGYQINDTPVVLILDTDEEIELSVEEEIQVGETYKFNYLENCKIAEVVEKIQR